MLCSIAFFFSENRAVYEIMYKNIVKPGRPKMTIWLMRIACWIPKATKTHLEYVTLTVFPQQQRLQEHASTVTLYVHFLSCWLEGRYCAVILYYGIGPSDLVHDTGCPFMASQSAVALWHRKPVCAGTSSDSCRAQWHFITVIMYNVTCFLLVIFLMIRMMAWYVIVIGRSTQRTMPSRCSESGKVLQTIVRGLEF